MELGEFSQKKVADKGFWTPLFKNFSGAFSDGTRCFKDVKTGRRGIIERTVGEAAKREKNYPGGSERSITAGVQAEARGFAEVGTCTW